MAIASVVPKEPVAPATGWVCGQHGCKKVRVVLLLIVVRLSRRKSFDAGRAG